MEISLDQPVTLGFEEFWEWMLTHPNCIVRAGTPETALYDDDDLHWHFASEHTGVLVVQLLRGKRLLGELLVEPDPISYVHGSPGEQEGEFVFELVSDKDADRMALYYFVLSHGFDPDRDRTPVRVH